VKTSIRFVPNYISDYIQGNKEQFPAVDLVELIPKWQERKASDLTLIDRYERATMGDDMQQYRLAYRYDHPELDAALNLWGKVKTVQTTTAYRLLQQACEELGIPVESVPALNSAPSSYASVKGKTAGRRNTVKVRMVR
jgi:hypothetical protein